MPLYKDARRHSCIASMVWLVLTFAGCSSTQKLPAPVSSATSKPQPVSAKKPPTDILPALPAAKSGRGGYYQDDGPGEHPPEGLQTTPDAVPKVEPYAKGSNRPYVVFGKTYTPITDDRPLSQRGTGSWYGKKFHGQRTSSGELYDMYKMTAAHPVLPIPSYARVSNLNNGKQIIVRINDRGPFHPGRIIDLSYTAALKLGYLGSGSSELLVERLLPGDIEKITQAQKNAAPSSVTVEFPMSTLAAAPHPVPSEIALMMQSDIATGASTQSLASTNITPVEAGTQSRSDSAPFLAQTTPPTGSTTFASVPTPASRIFLQLGAYAKIDNAQTARSRLTQMKLGPLPPVEVVANGNSLYRLYCGPFSSRSDAAAAALKLQESGGQTALLVER